MSRLQTPLAVVSEGLQLQNADDLRLQIDSVRRQRDEIHMHWVAPLIVTGIGVLGLLAAVIDGAFIASHDITGDSGVILIGAGGLLVLAVGLIWLGIDALVCAVRRGNLSGELHALEEKLALVQGRVNAARSSSPAFVLARF